MTIHNQKILQQQIESGNGCILLGSHLGSFEVVRTLGMTRHDFRLNVLMDIEHNENITRFLDSVNPEVADTVIASDRPDALLRVKERLDAGFLIGALGDRISSDGKTTQCRFLGTPATFPAGPILLAGVMHRPVILFFGLYRGGNHYEIYFEQLAAEVILDRSRRAENIQSWMQRYVDRLEHYTRRAPYNWFNFFPFWDQHPATREM